MITWPLALPQCPLRGTPTRQPKSNVIAFGTEIGPGKVRRRSSAGGVSTGATYLMTGAQLGILEAFYGDDLADGSLSFRMSDPISGADADWRFSPGQPWQAAEAGPDLWRVALQFERLP